ncbi:hypothetical protein SLNWT_1422 [Streptomyces albus]|uniref:Uncharacterized protein n=1 Tax=Streptomyces albus (strain ATCC 21838 / DSM 41398 / FERM P-419 / JCM 4703 / NBRC 107858) TaxID=1081613 RepID=A0A0B5EHY2_STRA4|nr:hypothetical protein SLNWT_1422 [Streptomyces albus]AOU76114.1 hypothetical protein SLNHY_1423 [Streptomyces albus]
MIVLFGRARVRRARAVRRAGGARHDRWSCPRRRHALPLYASVLTPGEVPAVGTP